MTLFDIVIELSAVVTDKVSRIVKILPHTAPYPFTLASLLGVSEHVDDHAVGVVL